MTAALVQSPSEASCTPGQTASNVIERPSRKRGGKQYNIDWFILRTMNSWREELQALGHLIFQVTRLLLYCCKHCVWFSTFPEEHEGGKQVAMCHEEVAFLDNLMKVTNLLCI